METKAIERQKHVLAALRERGRVEVARLLRSVRSGAVAAHTSRYDAGVEAFTAPMHAS